MRDRSRRIDVKPPPSSLSRRQRAGMQGRQAQMRPTFASMVLEGVLVLKVWFRGRPPCGEKGGNGNRGVF